MFFVEIELYVKKILVVQPDVTSFCCQKKMSMPENFSDQRNVQFIPVAPCQSSMVCIFTEYKPELNVLRGFKWTFYV